MENVITWAKENKVKCGIALVAAASAVCTLAAPWTVAYKVGTFAIKVGMYLQGLAAQ